MPKKIRVIVVLCLVFHAMFMLNPSTGYACSCAGEPTVEDELERSDAVFTGKVIEIQEKKQLNGLTKKYVLFEVKKTWKGISQSQVILTTGMGGGDCGYEFEEGKEYLVYATKSSFNDHELSTDICHRTRERISAQEDLALLGEGKAPTQNVNLEDEFRGTGPYVWLAAIVGLGIVIFIIWGRLKRYS